MSNTNLNSQYIDLIQQRHKLDRWFNKYLDLFSDKMTIVEKTDPSWKLYDTKAKVYGELIKNIQIMEYRMKRGNNV